MDINIQISKPYKLLTNQLRTLNLCNMIIFLQSAYILGYSTVFGFIEVALLNRIYQINIKLYSMIAQTIPKDMETSFYFLKLLT